MAVVLVLLALGLSAGAQTLQLRYTFEETGTTAGSSGALNVPLTLQDFAGAATDLHGAAGSGVQQQGKSLDLSTGTIAGGNGPVAQVVGDTTLGTGLGVISNFTATIWFKQQNVLTNTGSIGPRLFVLGTNGIVDQNTAGQSIAVWFQNTNAIYLKLNNSPTLAAPIYFNPLPTNVWLFVGVTYDGTNNASIYFGSEASPARLLTVRSIGTNTVNLGTSGTLMVGNRNNRQRVLDGWIDDFRFYTGDADAAFIESVRQASTPVLVTDLTPDGASLMQGTNQLSFNVSSANGINAADIKVAVNGADVSGSLVVGGTANNRTVSYGALPINPTMVANGPLNGVRLNIQVTDMGGIVTSNVYTYDAFSPTNFTVEAEDFNYGDPLFGPGGSYIDNPRYAFEVAPDTYWQREGLAGADYGDLLGTGNHIFRGPLDLMATEYAVSTGANGGNSVGDLMREKVRAALALNPGIREVNLGNFDTDDWVNYTRTYPVGPYNVYTRVANGGGSKIVTFNRVTGDTTQPGGQLTNMLGTFTFGGTGGWQSYGWVPLRDAGGNLVRVDLNGLDTFRISANPGGGGNHNFLMFAPANTNLPIISGVYPNGTNMFQPAANLTFAVTSPAGVTIHPAGITVTLTRRTILGVTVTNLSGINGLIVTGTATARNVAVPLTTNATYTAVINVVDENGSPANTTVNFDTYNPVFVWEAEDYNYSSGLYTDNPPPNGYAGQVGTAEVDYHDNVVVSQNGTPAYRTSDPVGLENCGDGPLRLEYIGTGFTDYDVGWYDNGNWNNYTRTFPAGDYNVYLRVANGSAGNGGLTLARVTSGETTTTQTTTNLGTFTIPATGGWQTYTWVPMRDAGGNLVKFTGGLQTLRATSSGGANVNFYALLPANTNLPNILNVYPGGGALFQATNRLSFNVTSAAGVNTSSISVNLNGLPLTGLTFTGNATAWAVSYIGLAPNTNHTALIQVTDLNGNSASLTVNFDTFSASHFTWEAEDYDYDGGLFVDNPQINAYANLSALADVDFHDANTDGTFVYRPTGTATEITADFGRTQFASALDYNIGFFGNNEWGNYTRHYPAGSYNVWGRFAAGGGETTAELSVVTGGWGTTVQTTNHLGTFNVGNSGWGSFSWAPLRDANGNLVSVAFTGATNTLKVARGATGPDANVNFFMLVPAPAAPVSITIARVASNIEISFTTQAGKSYQVEYKNELTELAWSTLGSPVSGDGTTKTVVDSIGINNRFYRLRVQ
jgi:hypothetical protein